MLKAPNFWWQKDKLYIWIFYFFSIIYGFFANKKFNRKALYNVNHPVLCVGNFILGGSGKTPLARAIALQAAKEGLKPVIIMRGYKGDNNRACLVDLAKHSAKQVGDEAILLAQNCNVIVSKKRFDSARLIEEHNFDFIILDDGFQSRKLHYDYSVIAVDTSRAFGNGYVFPSGPLRADLNLQLKHTNAIIFIRQKSLALPNIKNFSGEKYVAKLTAFICSLPIEYKSLKAARIYAFCAIGNASKFYISLTELGAEMVIFDEFADHHNFSIDELQKIVAIAKEQNLLLVTTAKDYARIKNVVTLNICIVDVDIIFKNSNDISQIINNTIKNYNCPNSLRKDISQSL